MSKKIIIIGAGATGLCAGIYLRKLGYVTEIYELHSIPGGLCTAWERKGYTFDGCIHWFCGSGPGNTLYDAWKGLGMMDRVKFIEHDVYKRIDLPDGRSFTVYSDADRLAAEMVKIAPEDAREIKAFTKGVKDFGKLMSYGTAGKKGLLAFLKCLPAILLLSKYRKYGTADYAARFGNDTLKSLMTRIFPGELSAIGIFMMLSFMHNRSGGYPLKGSKNFALELEKVYKELGGSVFYNARVKEVTVKDGKACGIRLFDGSEKNADAVISAADGHDTLYNMLAGKYLDAKLKNIYETWKTFPGILQFSFGARIKLPAEPQAVCFKMARPVTLAPGEKLQDADLRIYGFDPSMAPEGCTSFTMFYESDYQYWEELRQKDKAGYETQKKRIAEEMIDNFDLKFPGFKAAVEVWDVATPATFIRYTNNWKASFEGWYPTAKQVGKKLPMTLKGLKNFYMAGQWRVPGGGLPGAIGEGKAVSERIKKDNI